MNRLEKIRDYINHWKHERGKTWRECGERASKKFGNGYPMSAGLAQLISQGKDVASPEFRAAYKLGPRICWACSQKITIPRAPKKRKPPTEEELWWRAQPKERKRAIIRMAYHEEQKYNDPEFIKSMQFKKRGL